MKIRNLRSKSVLARFVILSASLVAGCAPTCLTLHSSEYGLGGTGIVRQSFIQPYQIEVTVNGDAYTGQWRTQEAPDHPLAKSYLHKREVGRVVTTLSDNKGRHLYCNWLVQSLRGYGTCEDDVHKKFDVTIG